jgi:hypothetical protein
MKKKKKRSWNTFQKLSNIFQKTVYNQGLISAENIRECFEKFLNFFLISFLFSNTFQIKKAKIQKLGL